MLDLEQIEAIKAGWKDHYISLTQYYWQRLSVRGPREPPRLKEVPEGQGAQKDQGILRGPKESKRAKGVQEQSSAIGQVNFQEMKSNIGSPKEPREPLRVKGASKGKESSQGPIKLVKGAPEGHREPI